jgi:hypothetical protein
LKRVIVFSKRLHRSRRSRSFLASANPGNRVFDGTPYVFFFLIAMIGIGVIHAIREVEEAVLGVTAATLSGKGLKTAIAERKAKPKEAA